MNTEYKRENRLIAVLLGVILCYWIYEVVIRELQGILNDYNGHVYVCLPLFSKDSFLEFWRAVPYFMWHAVVKILNQVLHIPLEAAAAYTSCLFTLFSYFVLYWMIQKVLVRIERKDHSLTAAIIAFGLSVGQGIYCSWLDAGDRFLGIYSMNPIHNPTQMCVLGFSLLSLCLVYDIWGRQKSEKYQGVFFRVEQGLKKYYLILAVILLCSVLAKPTFVEMFVPAVALVMLGNWIAAIGKKDGSASVYFRHCLHMLYCSLPALGYILIEYLNYFVLNGSYGSDDSHVVITKCMLVWSAFSENIVLSVLLGMAFPLFIVLLNPGFFIKKDVGRLALAGYLVGLAEAAFLGESEPRLYHANFLWPMMSGMTVMWVVSTLRLLVLERKYTDTARKQILIYIAWFIFGVHVLCGYLLLREMMGI